MEEIQALDIQDPAEFARMAREKESEFEDHVDDINNLAITAKIQMIEANFRHRQKYTRRQTTRVDKFEDKVYDSSYVIWVPYL